MRKIVVILLIGTGMVCSFQSLQAREFKEHQTKEFLLSGSAATKTLYIYNLSGSVKVQGYNGNSIIIDMDKTINADNDRLLENGKKELRTGFYENSDTIMAYLSEPFDTRPGRHCNHNDRNIDYDFTIDFTVKVPFNINVTVSTVNNGIIKINEVNGLLHINNVNDAISVTGAKGTTYAHTVNGNVTVSYLVNPSEESSYYTINGDINVSYQPGLSAVINFKSMHGDLFTDFPDTEKLPAFASKVREKNGAATLYKLNSETAIKIGKGGKTFKFETLNGNVYIKKQS